jgi:hypothetical protein
MEHDNTKTCAHHVVKERHGAASPLLAKAIVFPPRCERCDACLDTRKTSQHLRPIDPVQSRRKR